MIPASPLRSKTGRIEILSTVFESGASRYDPKLTGWPRFFSIVTPGLMLAGLGGVSLLFNGSYREREPKEASLEIFSVDLLPPPPPAPPAAPIQTVIETPVIARTPPIAPQTPAVLARPVVAVPAAAPASPPAVAPTLLPVATTSASTTPADSAPVYVSNPTCAIATPAYPTRAKRLQQTGTVRVAVTIDASGRIVAETVRKSSGYDALDDAALATVRGGRCRPNTDGRSITSVLPISFTLDR